MIISDLHNLKLRWLGKDKDLTKRFIWKNIQSCDIQID